MSEYKQQEILEDRRGKVVRDRPVFYPQHSDTAHPEQRSGVQREQGGTGGRTPGLPPAGLGGPRPHSGGGGLGEQTAAVAYRLFPQPYRSALDIKRSTINHEGKTLSPQLKADGLAGKVAESFFKIIGAEKSAHNMQKLIRSVEYISRDYSLSLEDERGNLYDEVGVQQILERWQRVQHIPTEPGEKSPSAVSRHAIISVPAGSDVEALRVSVRQLIDEVFTTKGYELLWTIHENNADYPNEPDHPHAHLIINALSHEDKRLDLRKADLRHIRERFAVIAREHGIELNATSRTVRGRQGAKHLRRKAILQKQAQQAQRAPQPRQEQSKDDDKTRQSEKWRQRAYQTREAVIANSRDWGKILVQSEQAADKQRGIQLLSHAAKLVEQREDELILDRAQAARAQAQARIQEAIKKRKQQEREIKAGRATYSEAELKKQRYARLIRERRERALREQEMDLGR